MRVCEGCGGIPARGARLVVTLGWQEVSHATNKFVIEGDYCFACYRVIRARLKKIFTVSRKNFFASMAVKGGAHNTSPVSEPCASGTDE